MDNQIKSFKINEIPYSEPSYFFDNIDRGFMPSMLTGKGPQDISKESIIASHPVKRETISNQETLWEQLEVLNNSIDFHDKPYPINRLGAIGFISYEALHSTEKIDKQTTDHISMPLAEWMIYSNYYYFDHNLNKSYHIEIIFKNNLERLIGKNHIDNGFKVTNLKSDFTTKEYKQNVLTILNKIKEGEVYEVNLTQGIVGGFKGSPYSLFKKLYKNNSAPYSAYLERDDFSVICNSPEMFLKAENNRVETRPIKGTAPRSDNPEIDEQNRVELSESLKNQSELYMIVDLMRNDLSKVCKIGTVKVIKTKRTEIYKNVHHLVAIIEGYLKDNKSYIDLLKATFPGGSITGCPKVSCMALTEEIERSSRNLYTGTIFLMNKRYLNSSIVIRSAVVKDNKIVLNSGGAITIDSDPSEEYQESRIKLVSLFKAVDYEDNI